MLALALDYNLDIPSMTKRGYNEQINYSTIFEKEITNRESLDIPDLVSLLSNKTLLTSTQNLESTVSSINLRTDSLLESASINYNIENEEKFNYLVTFAKELVTNSKDIDGVFVSIVDELFWDLF